LQSEASLSHPNPDAFCYGFLYTAAAGVLLLLQKFRIWPDA
jgi:hypothetical protein